MGQTFQVSSCMSLNLFFSQVKQIKVKIKVDDADNEYDDGDGHDNDADDNDDDCGNDSDDGGDDVTFSGSKSGAWGGDSLNFT